MVSIHELIWFMNLQDGTYRRGSPTYITGGPTLQPDETISDHVNPCIQETIHMNDMSSAPCTNLSDEARNHTKHTYYETIRKNLGLKR